MRTRILVIGLTIAVVAAVAAIQVPRVGSTSPQGMTRYSLDDARAFEDFPLYYLGASFDGAQLRRIYRVNALPLPGEPTRRNDVSFIYGVCENEKGNACLPPMQVQVWDACERYRDLYPFRPEAAPSLRGVPGAVFNGGRRIELYTGRVTVVIFGRDPVKVKRAVTALRGVNNATPADKSLAPPVPGALTGELCA